MDLSWLKRGARKLTGKQYCGVVIVAAGTASRMGGIDKIVADLGGEPVILRSVRAFSESEVIREIVIVTRPDLIPQINELCGGLPKVRAVVAGGRSRQESVSQGLSALSDSVTLCAVHDGARPLVSGDVIARTVRAAEKFGAAAPAVPVKGTIKVARGGLVESTPDRSTLYGVQTPQIFDYDLLRGALKKAETEGTAVTDDCSAVENLGMKIKLVPGDERNIKITSPLDLRIGELLLEDRK